MIFFLWNSHETPRLQSSSRGLSGSLSANPRDLSKATAPPTKPLGQIAHKAFRRALICICGLFAPPASDRLATPGQERAQKPRKWPPKPPVLGHLAPDGPKEHGSGCQIQFLSLRWLHTPPPGRGPGAHPPFALAFGASFVVCYNPEKLMLKPKQLFLIVDPP